ncbi:4-hydroxy-tetrahydrodipicolinate reductase [Ruminococcaceae bacterium OttesenSCG-928-L11]|nr:4-hydroxy-tetrahydrodipicolinate reductase [Ruminococcaceae bacterium OttesenSCG-928-L11]
MSNAKVVKMIVSGCNGKMGRVITDCVASRDDCAIVAGIDLDTSMNGGYPVFSQASQCLVEADVLIDFSHPSALEPLLEMAVARGLPAVISTTGLSREQVETIEAAARKIPVFFSANMSLGVNLMLELSKIAAKLLGSEFDIEIVEKHHNQKIDAPSGTALMLADGISSVLPKEPQYVYDRHSQRKKRAKNEIGLHAIRGGTITGEHDVIFAGRDEVLTISHSASSKEVFATGSVNAALFLHNQQPGLYKMSHLIEG